MCLGCRMPDTEVATGLSLFQLSCLDHLQLLPIHVTSVSFPDGRCFDVCLRCQMSFFRERSVVNVKVTCWNALRVSICLLVTKNWPQIRQIHNVYCINFLNLREVTKARDWNINSLFPSSRSMLARLDPNPDGLIHAAIHNLSNVSNRGKSSKICQNQPFIRCQR